ncbi:MAG: cytochrome c [Gammaproteobacteria bacterium]|nr:cytochrome c [Gammaproteobacteria bacterium]MDH3507096.1 cytochrome c [Gammaproteobacteria bacterium]
MQLGINRAFALLQAVCLTVLLAWRPGLAQEVDDRVYLPMQTSINALMVALVDHSAHELWRAGSAQTLSALDWRTVEQHAIQLIASGTLISLGGTGVADAGWVAAPAWQEWNQRMTDGALAALAAVRATDQDALNAAGSALVDACQGCHQAFKPELPTEGFVHTPHYEMSAQQDITLRSTIVTLAAEPALRREFERGLTDKARQRGYNVVASYDLVPDVTDVDDPDFVGRLVSNGIGAVLMIRPAAVGPGTTLEAVRNSVSPSTYANMQAFAQRRSRAGRQDLLAVVHLGIYLISVHGAELISSGAVWLDEPNPSRQQGIERLQNLIVANVDAVRPAIREHLGLPPLNR